jgi:uncharacterized membrane protein YraQ (UPF0718 family)
VEFYRCLRYLSKPLFISLAVASAVQVLVSEKLIFEILGNRAALSIPIAILLGIPFYNCGGAAIPLIEKFQDLGMGQGAVLAFFIAGPATKLHTLYVFKASFGLKIFFLYACVTLGGACVLGAMLAAFGG